MGHLEILLSRCSSILSSQILLLIFTSDLQQSLFPVSSCCCWCYLRPQQYQTKPSRGRRSQGSTPHLIGCHLWSQQWQGSLDSRRISFTSSLLLLAAQAAAVAAAESPHNRKRTQDSSSILSLSLSLFPCFPHSATLFSHISSLLWFLACFVGVQGEIDLCGSKN
jgi:hypothetical protein